ncbi:MAG TPA: SRPBCC family protein [Planctomycetaceae bacterium]|nr:SRPBCC family protein [Planctomycetaceae bacterium]
MPATFTACPTAIVDAPIDVVWNLLTEFAGWGKFYDVRVISVEPPGPAAIGQQMRGESGPRWLHLGVSFEFTRIETHRKLELDIKLPLGITVHEDLDCVPLDDHRCRVNYHCHFAFPEGWRGGLVRRLLSRGLTERPADSLSRLKRAAEQAHREGGQQGRVVETA